MQLRKLSARTARKPCANCGMTDLYWFADDKGNKFLVLATDRTREIAQSEYADVSAQIHACHLERYGEIANQHKRDMSRIVLPEAMPADWGILGGQPERTEIVSKYGQNVQETVEAARRIDAEADAAGERLKLLQQLLNPSIDSKQVEAIVDAKLRDREVPTRTVVYNPATQETKPVEGLTHEVLSDVLTSALTGDPTLMVGPAGTGKSSIARNVAETLDADFYEVSLDPGMSAAQMFGYMSATGDYVSTVFRRAFESENLAVLHLDELDNGHPSVVAKCNAALALAAGQSMAFPDGMVAKGKVIFLASGNTYGTGPDAIYVGRNQLDGATLNRFNVIDVDYDQALESSAAAAIYEDFPKIVSYVRSLRNQATNKRMHVVFGMRNTLRACRLMAAGQEPEKVIRQAIRGPVSDADWAKLDHGMKFTA